LTPPETDYNLFLNPQKKGKKVKNAKHLLLALLILTLALAVPVGCAKKTVQSQATPYTTYERPKAIETPPETKPEASAPDQQADLEKERKVKEEALREEDLKAKAAREEAARREAQAREAAKLKGLKLETVYFDYNQYVVREDEKEKMVKNAEWLKANPRVKIVLAGHCDDRGTAEYNLALGQKRAEAAKAFLLGLGIAENRLQTISYGLERPAEKGRNEEAWAKNRRGEFTPAK
jgi:peptidoglycan-associated lipoprotein